MKKNAFALAIAAVVSLAALLPLTAAEAEVYVYTYEGKANINRGGKVGELKLDMPMKNGDSFKIEPDSSIDFVFFKAAGMRVNGPSEVLALGTTSISDIRMRVSAGNILVHTERPGEAFQYSLETPHALIRITEPALIQVVAEAGDKKTGSGGKTAVFVKKGWVDTTVKVSDASIRVLENQKVEITPETFIPPARGAQPEELEPAERARTVYVPKAGAEEEEDS